MAFDGITISNLVYELNECLTGGGIQKIAQPEKDALLLTIKNNKKAYRLVLSAGASLPLVYLTEENKVSPITAPNFCMVLRKHLNGARILSISQPGLERVIEIKLQNLNELGDETVKYLMVELMGKHSNIIFLNEDKQIIDSIKHVSALVSSVREVLPGKPYFVPNTREKQDTFSVTEFTFCQEILEKPMPVIRAIYSSLTGISSSVAAEIAYRAGIDGDSSCKSLSQEEKKAVYQEFHALITNVKTHKFLPNIVFKDHEPIEFAAFPLHIYECFETKQYHTMSEVIEYYYGEKDVISRIRQKSVDLRKIVTTLLERNRKKLLLQEKQMNDTNKREKYKVYGELLQTYGYQCNSDDTVLTCINYYDNKEISIPLDNSLSPIENANKYFNRYNKLKRTYEALTTQIQETKDEITHLESVLNALDIARREEDLSAIKEELIESGYIRKKASNKKNRALKKSKPMHFRSSDGYDIYVGKNNYQNEELTFKFASGNDWWFHAKGIAGSHVIVKCNGEEPPIQTFEEAAALAAYFSKGRGSDKLEIDYTIKKNVKKPNGSKPGFVVYYTNYSMMASGSIHNIELVSKEDEIFLERR